MLAGTSLMTSIKSPLCFAMFSRNVPSWQQTNTKNILEKDIPMHHRQAAMILQFCTARYVLLSKKHNR